MVIDSLTSFLLLFDRDIEKRRAILSLFNILRRWDCTTIVTYEKDSSTLRAGAPDVLEFESDRLELQSARRILVAIGKFKDLDNLKLPKFNWENKKGQNKPPSVRSLKQQCCYYLP